MDGFVCVEGLLIVSTTSVAARNHQVPFDLVWSATVTYIIAITVVIIIIVAVVIIDIVINNSTCTYSNNINKKVFTCPHYSSLLKVNNKF